MGFITKAFRYLAIGTVSAPIWVPVGSVPWGLVYGTYKGATDPSQNIAQKAAADYREGAFNYIPYPVAHAYADANGLTREQMIVVRDELSAIYNPFAILAAPLTSLGASIGRLIHKPTPATSSPAPATGSSGPTGSLEQPIRSRLAGPIAKPLTAQVNLG